MHIICQILKYKYSDKVLPIGHGHLYIHFCWPKVSTHAPTCWAEVLVQARQMLRA